jgi:hypothetical protein
MPIARSRSAKAKRTQQTAPPDVDLGLLNVGNVIVHDLPHHRAGEEGPTPTLSEVESPANVELRNFIRERVIETLKGRSFEVSLDPDSTSPVPNLVRRQLRHSPPSFVTMSQDAARHLFQVQAGANPAGLLVVLTGTLGRAPALGIMKLEREEAIRLNPQTIRGRRTFNLQHLADLMLNKKTKVFKTGLFWPSPADVVGRVCDLQLGRDLAREVANFFLQAFLGCKLAEEPAVVTKRFWDTTERFINEQVPDPERQTSYLLGLTAEMKSQKDQVTPRSFATEHIGPEDRDAFRAILRASGLDTPFPKDVERIATRIQQVQYEFASGLRLLGPADVVGERVTLEQREDTVHVEFDDQLKGLRGKGR